MLTDKQIKALRARLVNVGREVLIDRLENQMINKNLQGDEKAVARLEASISYVRKANDWIISQ